MTEDEATANKPSSDAVGAPVERPVRPLPEPAITAGGVKHLADILVMRAGARDIPTGDLYRGIAERQYHEARIALFAAIDELERAVAAEREKCAAWVDRRRLEFCFQHANHDPHTGAVEFGRGPHADAKGEYVGELEEIAAGLRALKA